jgi:hypothetical protein
VVKVHILTPITKQSKSVDIFSTELSTAQNATENETQPIYIDTSLHKSLRSKQSNYTYKEEVQTGDFLSPFLHQPKSVGIFPTELPSNQNTTENKTQPESLDASFQNSLNNQQPIYPFKQEVQTGNIHCETPFNKPANRL